MILAIKTDQPMAELHLCNQGAVVDGIKWLAHRELADTIHIKINDLTQKHNLSLGDITGIIVFEGPGSFTGLRIGITVANTLAYGLNILIVGTSGENWISLGLEKLKSGESDKIVVPKYGGEPNISKPKK